MKPIQSTITLNDKERLFVIGVAAGVTCLGYDVCHERSKAMASWLGEAPPNDEDKGTMKGYERFRALVEACRVRFEKTGEKCPAELTPQLIGLEGKRVEVVDKWDERRRFIVGKSTGWIPCHLEIESRRASGGHAVSGAPFKSVQVV